MLHVHRSERADALVAALGVDLRTVPADPFAAEIVAVPSRGIERWLAQQLSHVLGAVDGDGVCANVHFPAVDQLLDDAAAAADPAFADSSEAWSAPRVVWPLVEVIDACADEPWCRVLGVHLAAAGTERGRRFAVAAKLARLFARYGRSRPQMLRAWAGGADEQGDGTPLPDDLSWQAELWRRLRTAVGTPSPAELLDAVCARIADGTAPLSLPERFSVFGVTRISPARVQVLTALAQRRELHLWLHHPSPALWTAVGEAGGAALRRDELAGERLGNPLLASLSRDVRELQLLLAGPSRTDVHHPIEPRPDTLLGRLQGALAEDAAPAVAIPVAADDHSLRIHACHGRARQVEVVREVVLGLLRDDPTLEPRDVLIMCPDVETFAPLVAAAFGMADEPGAHPAAGLRVRLADRALRQTNPLLGLLGGLLELAGRRVTATELLDLASTEPVRRRFGFSEDDIERLREWTSAANARWGLDAAHREPYGLGGVDQGTWRVALDRLLLGVAMGEGEQYLGEVLALHDVDSAAIELAGRFAEFLDRADHAVRTLEQTHTVTEWTVLLGDLVLSLGDGAQAWQAVQLAGELGDVADAASDTDVRLSRADVATLLADRLAGRPSRASFRTGTLTVCTLVPMRSVPHRVVVLIGMDDGAFPRTGAVDGDDVLAREPRVGERDPRSEDRQLFLDALCAAQERLVIAYTGADPRSGATVPPCVPLGELLDGLDALATAPDGTPVRGHVVTAHPLQPFDARNFTPGVLGGEQAFSFDPSGLAGARAAAGPRHDPRPLVGRPLPPAPVTGSIALADLISFLCHPARQFLRQRLQLSSWEADDDPNDALAVTLDSLQLWAVGDRLLRRRLAGVDLETCWQIERRRGDLPPGQLGRRLMSQVKDSVEAILSAVGDLRATPAASAEVDVRLDDGRRLQGTVPGLHAESIVSVTYSSLGPKQRIEAWVRYLALVATTRDPRYRAVAIGRSTGGARRSVLRGIDPDDAAGILTWLALLRDAGLREPLPMALKTSEAYAVARHQRQDVPTAVQRAASRWQAGNYPGEDSDRAHVLTFGAGVPLTDLMASPAGPDEVLPGETTRFGALARRLWTPLLEVESA